MNRRALLLLAGLLLAGCPAAEGAPCVQDDECAEGLTCFAGTCQQLGTPDGTVAFEVLPPNGSGLPPAVFPYGPQPLTLSFCAPSTIRGSLGDGIEGEATVAIEGTPAGLPGRVDSSFATVGPEFSLPLSPGAWTLTFGLPPVDGRLPPPVVRRVQLARCESTRLDPIEPPPHRTARLRPVVDAERDPRPRCGLLVRLVDPEDGRALSQDFAIRQPTDGQGLPTGPCTMPAEGWELDFVPPEGDEVELQVRPLDPARPAVFSQERRVAVGRDAAVDLGVFSVLGPEATLERLQVDVVDPDGAPVTGALVGLDPFLATEGLWFRPAPALPVSGVPGLYELWTLPGSYKPRALHPTRPDLAPAHCFTAVDGNGGCSGLLEVDPATPASYRVQLERTVRLSGTVLDSDGRTPLPEARVSAEPLDGGRRASATTNGGGRYELRLDPGRYELVVQPREPEAPWRRVALDGPLLVDESRNLVLPQPARVVGAVMASRGAERWPLPDALVRAWRLRDDGPPQVIGEALVDSEGRFALALPAAP